jgi:predicted transposase/invertase (TIGR01784 family)
MSDITNPHDKFFKETFTQPEVARDFLANYLPPHILPLLDLSQIELEKESFIDPELQEHFSDLLYSVPLVGRSELLFIYILLEHKSYPDPLTPLQLLGYMVRFWERRVRQGSKTLDALLPLVLYHGRERWSGSQRLSDLYNGPEEFRLYLPDFAYQLSDFSRYSNEEIKGEVMTQIVLRLFHAIFDPQLSRQLPEIFKLFWQLANQETAIQYLETVLRYLSVTAERVTPDELRRALEVVFPQQGDELMPTLAQQWREEGRQEGRQEGLLAGMRQNIQDLLEERLAVPKKRFQAQLAGLDNLDTLRLLVRRAATVDSVAEFEQALDTLVAP